jgi:multidrug resistance efflux pump
LRLAEANERRYRALVETGDTAVSTYDQFRTQRDTARARVNAARQQLESALNTARQSNQAIQTAESAVSSARAQVAIAQKAVADAIIRAPYAGYVSNRPIAVGEYVTPAASSPRSCAPTRSSCNCKCRRRKRRSSRRAWASRSKLTRTANGNSPGV